SKARRGQVQGRRPAAVRQRRHRQETGRRRSLEEREGDVVKGTPITAQVGKVRFEEASPTFSMRYRTNKKRSLATITLRIDKHLTPFFWRASHDGNRHCARPGVRRAPAGRGAANGSINRDLTALKRMFTLAVQGREFGDASLYSAAGEQRPPAGSSSPTNFRASSPICRSTCRPSWPSRTSRAVNAERDLA